MRNTSANVNMLLGFSAALHAHRFDRKRESMLPLSDMLERSPSV